MTDVNFESRKVITDHNHSVDDEDDQTVIPKRRLQTKVIITNHVHVLFCKLGIINL